jgi:uridine kinase
VRPTVLAIAGGTASGKSTIAEAVVKALGADASHVTHDRYYKTVDRALAHHPDRVKLHNYDHPDALETDLLVDHLRDLKLGCPVQVPDYDFADSARKPRAQWSEIQPRPIVVIEGILILAHDGLRSLFDQIVFVDAPDDIRLARRMRRDIVERGQAPHEVIDQYLAMVRPMHERFVAPSRAHAHLVLDGTSPVDGLVTRVLGLVGRRA